jgi:hypothetical protein
MDESLEAQLSGADLLREEGLDALIGRQVLDGVTLERAVELCRHVLPMVKNLYSGLQNVEGGTEMVLDAVGSAIPEDVRTELEPSQLKKKLMNSFQNPQVQTT